MITLDHALQVINLSGPCSTSGKAITHSLGVHQLIPPVCFDFGAADHGARQAVLIHILLVSCYYKLCIYMDHALQATLGVHPPVCFDFGKADMDDDKQ